MGYINRQSVGLLVLLVLSLFIMGWLNVVEQKQLRNNTLLVDHIMQLRVELSQSHYQIHEQTELSQEPLERSFVEQLTDRIRASADFLNGVEVQVGRISGRVVDQHAEPDTITRLQGRLVALTSYLENNHAILNRDEDEDAIHDELFRSAETVADDIDGQVHDGVSLTIEEQHRLFMLMLVVIVVVFTMLLLFLRRSYRKELQAKQHSSTLSQALEYSGEAAIITDRDGTIQFVNEAFARITGYRSDEAMGMRPSILNSGKQNQEFYADLWDTVTDGRVWKGELINRRKDGSLYPALMTVAPLYDGSGSITHFVANQRDISEYKALENRSFQAQKLEAIGTLASGMAHDFNNVLSGITAHAYLINQFSEDSERVQKHCTLMREACDSAATHIRQILSYARNDPVMMASIELNRCVQTVSAMASAMIPSTIALEFISYGKDVSVFWNEAQLQQILINLINNARYALQDEEQPRITIELRDVERRTVGDLPLSEASYICLSVKDNGCGMPKDVMAHIFDPFFTTKEPGEGTGLGLAMAHDAISKVGGCLTVDSMPDKGSEFRIYLPVDHQAEAEADAPDDQLYEGCGETVLIADDDPFLLKSQSEILKSIGYEVLTASNGLEAVGQFERFAERIALVILDLVMPEMSGMDAARAIRKMNPASKIIFATGHDLDNALDNDPVDAPVIQKPYQPSVMSRLIREQINRQVIRFKGRTG